MVVEAVAGAVGSLAQNVAAPIIGLVGQRENLKAQKELMAQQLKLEEIKAERAKVQAEKNAELFIMVGLLCFAGFGVFLMVKD